MHIDTVHFGSSVAAVPQRRVELRLVDPPIDDRFAGVGAGWFLVLSRRRPETLGSAAPAAGPRNATRWLYAVEPRARQVRPLTGIESTEAQRVIAWASDGGKALLDGEFGNETLVTEIDLRTGATLHRVVVSDIASVSYAFPSESALLVDDAGDLRVVYLNGSREVVFAEDSPLVHHRRIRQLTGARPGAAVSDAISRLFPLDLGVTAVAHPAQ